MTYSYIGVDVGGTKIFAARFSEQLEVLGKTEVSTQSNLGHKKVLENIIKAIEKVRDKTTVSIGISWAGFVDSETGIIKKAPNIKDFENFPLAEYISKKTELPVFLENDSRLFALAEQKLDPARPRVLLGIILGTGVGSGIIVDGKIFRGATNSAGEIGHTILDTKTGKEVEELIAGPALQKLFHEKIRINDIREIDEILSQKREEIYKILEPILDKFAVWIYNLVLTFNPSKIVFGGGFGRNFWVHFEKEIQKKTRQIITRKKYPVSVEISFSRIENAGAIGAAISAKDKR